MVGRKIRILMVCMGNICRSPTAQGVFESLLARSALAEFVEVDSAGTHAYHVGASPDPRAQAAAAARGFDLSHQRARRVRPEDFERFDYIVAMDADNLAELLQICPSEVLRQRVRRFMDFAPTADSTSVPDPYYGGQRGFERVLDLIEDASRGMLAHLEREHFRRPKA
jgi:protein-tyrosine phosphatase